METDDFGTVLFFVRERDVNEKESSDTGEAGFNSKAGGGSRVQFRGLGSQPGSIHDARGPAGNVIQGFNYPK